MHITTTVTHYIKTLCISTACLIVLFSCSKDDSALLDFKIEGTAFNAVSFENLHGATISLHKEGAGASGSSGPFDQTTTDQNGYFVFDDIRAGSYSLVFQMTGYKSMFSSIIELTNQDAYVAFLAVTDNITLPVGGITGTVTDNDGNPLPGANIAISAQDETITNGYFSSVNSNEDGQFFIGAVPLESTSLFKVRSIADGFETHVIQNINILESEMVVLHFKMETSAPFNEVFFEGFESGSGNWEMNGLWDIQSNADIFNQAYPDFVKLAPNDNSEGRIANAYRGNRMAWYGNPETGNYIGEQNPFDNPLSGGTSTSPHSGNLLSPVISLTGLASASVNFWSWFEIESVNPNQLGYDLMEIYVIDSNGGETLLGKLNPYTDPILTDRRAIPFTSGGFNQAPVWKYEEFDLSTFAGSSIRLKFHFDTRDGLYNGFRGWFIDDIRITDRAASELKSMPDTSGPLMERD